MELEHQLEQFLTGDMAKKAVVGLRDGSKIHIFLEGRPFTFSKILGQINVIPEAKGRPEISFWLSENALRRILAESVKSRGNVGYLGIKIFEGIFTQNKENKINFKVSASFLKLWQGGYFSVLKTGGPEIGKYLGEKGLSSFTVWKKIFK